MSPPPVRPPRIAIAAEEAAGVQTIRSLLELPDPPEVVAVLTTGGPDAGGRPIVQEAALALGLPTWPAAAVRDPELAERLRGAAVDLLLNVHSRFLIHPDVLAAPRVGSFNLHPGPLPEYAGLNAPSWAIYRGERTHAVTLHWVDAGIDTGPIAYATSFEISDDDTGLSVAGKCVRGGVPLVLQLVREASVDASRIPRVEQDLAHRRYFGKEPPNRGWIDWSRTAAEIVRFVRAADYGPFPSPWGHLRTELLGRQVGIAKARLTGMSATDPPGTVTNLTEAGVVVTASDESVLVERLWVDGRSLRPSEVHAAQ